MAEVTQHPTARVIRALRRAGLREVPLPGGMPSLWLAGGSDHAMSWEDATDWLADVANAQATARLVRPYWQTSEFWMGAAGLTGAGMTAVAAVGDFESLHPAAGAVAAAAAVVLPVLYRFARERAKEAAARDLLDASREAPTKPPRARLEG